MTSFIVRSAILVAMASAICSPAAMACGGGGSGGYRKPLRPDQIHHHSSTSSTGDTSQLPDTSSATPAASK